MPASVSFFDLDMVEYSPGYMLGCINIQGLNMYVDAIEVEPGDGKLKTKIKDLQVKLDNIQVIADSDDQEFDLVEYDNRKWVVVAYPY
jgi:hypothetical protein